MAKPGNSFELWGQYLAMRSIASLIELTDVSNTLRLAAGLGRQLYRLDRRHRERATSHIAMAFPELNRTELDALTLKNFEAFCQLVVEVVHTPRLIHADSWAHRLKLTNMAEAIKILTSPEPCLMVTGHVGNWEVLGTLMAVLGFRVDALARPLDNPLINDWALGIREKRGLRIITKFQATDRMLSVLDAGGSLGFIADQNAGRKGLFVPFFGKLASTYKSIGLLAIQRELPVVCGYARRVGEDYEYELGVVDIIRPNDWADQPDPLYYVTARYMRAIEQMVRIAPHQYLWMHRRWKSRPRHEERGNPMPKGLVRNLESLPWMTPDLMDSVSQPLPV